MSCPTELALSMFADDALAAAQAADVAAHVATCAACRGRVAALRDEAGALRRALAFDATTATVPAFVQPTTLGAMGIAAAAALLLAAVFSLARTLIDAEVPDALRWFNPLDSGGVVNLAVRIGVFLLSARGSALIASIFGGVASLVAFALLWWAAAAVGRRIRGPLLLASVASAVALQPTPSHAVEIRHDDKGAVSIAAGETIDDTLIAVGETVEVNGNVNGDLIAFGKRVVVRGNVAGLVLAGGDNVTLAGAVDGSVLAGGQSLEIASRRIGRNVFAGGESVTLSDAAAVEQNVLIGGETVAIDGRVGRDAIGAASELEVAGNVGGALTAYAKRLTVLAPARIAGDVHAHGLENKDHVVVSPGAVIGGQLTTTFEPWPGEENRYLTARFYGWQLVWFTAALVTGVALLWIVPALRRVPFDGARDALRSAGYGLVALVATPIIAVLACVSIVGLPLGVMALLLWAMALYVAKLVVAQLVGTRLLETVAQRRAHFAAAFAAGLFVVTLAVNLPLVGGLIAFAATLLGLGLLVSFVRDVVFDDPLEDE